MISERDVLGTNRLGHHPVMLTRVHIVALAGFCFRRSFARGIRFETALDP
jgi:hypothetical protein